MVDYEKGTPAWDIGMILTIHASAGHGDAKGDCGRVASLIDTRGRPAAERLKLALAAKCTCGADESVGTSAITTSLRQPKAMA